MKSKRRFMAIALWILAGVGVADRPQLPPEDPADEKKPDLYVMFLPVIYSS